MGGEREGGEKERQEEVAIGREKEAAGDRESPREKEGQIDTKTFFFFWHKESLL